MAITDLLFGGSKQASTSGIAAPQLPYLQDVWGGAQNLYQQGQADPSATVAGFTPTQQQGQQMALGAAQQMQPMIGGAQQAYQGMLQPSPYVQGLMPQAQGAMQTAMAGGVGGPAGAPTGQAAQFTPDLPTDALNRMMSGNINMDPYNQAAQAAMGQLTEQFQEGVLPGLKRANRASSPYGSTRGDIASGIAAGKMAQAGRGLLSDIYGRAAEQAQQQVGQGAGLALQGQGLRLGAAELGERGRQFGGELGLGYEQLGEQSRQFGQGQALTAADLAYGNLNQQQANALNALGMTPQMLQAGMMPSDVYQQVGGQQQAMQQSLLDAPYDVLERYRAAIGGPVTQTTSTGRSQGGIIPGISGFFGG